MILPGAGINDKGHLTLAGHDTVELAAKYGTPMYLMNEARLRQNCRTYVEGMSAAFAASLPLYASKAMSTKRVYEIVAQEGMGTDVVSAGEMYIALKAGFDPEKIFFHGNSKPVEEIEYAMDKGIGYFIIDNEDELRRVNAAAAARGVTQKALLRLTPGIDTHTYEAVRTGQVDSKFGVAIETGQAAQFLRLALTMGNVAVEGFHCHIGSQVFDSKPFLDSADIMLAFIAEAKQELGFVTKMLNLGGGYGVRYVESDPHVDIAAEIGLVGAYVKKLCARLGVDEPMILMEPGRSIVADTMLTLYTVNAVKEIPGVRNYVSVDGGMTDNPRYALYRSRYEAVVANKASQPADYCATIAGRCCESGDMLGENMLLQKAQCGDTVAVMVTGAYNHSMASNYNCIGRPPVVVVNEEGDYLAVRRETFEDMAAREL